jgi:hypothetical protein
MGQQPRKTPSNYQSGTDFTMEFGKFRFRFNTRDFRERVDMAATQLAFVQPGTLGGEELDQLVELVAHGEVRSDGPLAAHLSEHREALLGFDDDLVHWLRKLVFRGAWIDQQIKEDLVEPVFDGDDFVYRCTVTSDLIDEIVDKPDWSEVGFRADPA